MNTTDRSPTFLDSKAWEKLSSIIDSWRGTPYMHLGMEKGRGADCTLFIGACWLEMGILTELTYDLYTRDWFRRSRSEQVLEGLYKHFSDHAGEGYSFEQYPGDISDLIRGDILTFSTPGSKVTNHAGIYTGTNKQGGGMMAHAAQKRGVSDQPIRGFWSDTRTHVVRIYKAIK